MEIKQKIGHVLFLLIGIMGFNPAFANDFLQDINHELLLFPFLHLEVQTNDSGHGAHEHDKVNLEYGGDIVYSLSLNRFRMINEVYFTDNHVDLERLQLGYQFSDTSTLWAGRFHVPVGYWNSQYHHSLHLQTSVHRPAILEFEDEHGPLSNHMTGIMLSNNFLYNEGNVGTHLAIGTAPILDGELKSWGASSDKDKHKWKVNAILSWQVDELDPTQYGLSIGYSKIASIDTAFESVNQSVAGIFAHQDWHFIRLTTELFLVSSDTVYSNTTNQNRYGAVYSHLEYDFGTNWTVYGRLERGFKNSGDEFLAAIEHDSLDRNLIGIRYEISRRQAISAEIPQLINDHDTQTHMSFQWTGMFP